MSTSTLLMLIILLIICWRKAAWSTNKESNFNERVHQPQATAPPMINISNIVQNRINIEIINSNDLIQSKSEIGNTSNSEDRYTNPYFYKSQRQHSCQSSPSLNDTITQYGLTNQESAESTQQEHAVNSHSAKVTLARDTMQSTASCQRSDEWESPSRKRCRLE